MTHLGRGGMSHKKSAQHAWDTQVLTKLWNFFLGLIWNVLEKLEGERKEEQAMVKATSG